jgi:hypothetical protein
VVIPSRSVPGRRKVSSQEGQCQDIIVNSRVDSQSFSAGHCWDGILRYLDGILGSPTGSRKHTHSLFFINQIAFK